MTLSFTEEHDQLRHLVRRFLDETSTTRSARHLVESGANRDNDVWSRMADQLGLQGLAISVDHGGSGYGPVELGIGLEEMGRALLVAPYLASVALAGQTLTLSADEDAQRRWLPGIADGSLTATLALAEESGSWSLDTITTTATATGDAWRVNGTKSFVVDGHTADLLLVVARAADGIGVFAVEGTAVGVLRTPLDNLDLTRGIASVELIDAPAHRIGGGRDALEWLGEVRDHVLAAISSEQVGAASRCLDLAVDYAKIREQFGRPIGSFQAIKHKCASLLVEIENARSAVYHANAALADGDPEASISAAVAHACASRASVQAAKECIQIHGGIGFTWEHDAHLFLRRAKSSQLLYGSPREERVRIADLVGI
jgi:alkylation response protein AidB-like acyl-CoA dehydrogenase